MRVASKLLGANIAQYVAAATHIRCTDSDSMASKGKHHQESLQDTKRLNYLNYALCAYKMGAVRV